MAHQTQDRLMTALKKAGLTVEQSQINDSIFWVKGSGIYGGQFIVQDGHITQMHVKRVTDETRPEIDYFPGHFARTIKAFVADLLEGVAKI